MGYSTSFAGTLTFADEPRASELARLNSLLEEEKIDGNYVDLQIAADFSGVEWTGAEKTYGMQETLNAITAAMRGQYPDFRFQGELLAQGEDRDDRYRLRANAEGKVEKIDEPRIGQRVSCPHCDATFTLDAEAAA